MNIIHTFNVGDIVKVLINEPMIPKGSIGVITETSPICWEVSVKLYETNREWGMTNKCIKLVKSSPVSMKYLIKIKEEEFSLFPHEVYELYIKLKRIKRKFTFKNRKVVLNNKDKEYSILFDFIKKIIKQENFLNKQ